MFLFNIIFLVLILPLNHVYAAENGRFHPYKDNEVLIIQRTSGGDEKALAGNFSFRYDFFNCSNKPGEFLKQTLCPSQATGGMNVFFSYTTAFDFYMYDTGNDTVRASKPIINRLNNPALHFVWENTNLSQAIGWWGISLEHRSNGQVISADLKNAAGEYLTQVQYNQGKHEYFDALSRSGNYITLALGGKGLTEQGNFLVSYKIYVKQKDEEASVTWGPLAGTQTKFSDYDRINLSFFEKFDEPIFKSVLDSIGVGLDFMVGDKGLPGASIDFKLTILSGSKSDSWSIPWYLKIHNGPMERLSDYSTPYYSLGLGIDFDY
jgi:hypothetical protein